MAQQRNSWTTRAARLTRRFGLRASPGPVLVCILFVAAAAVMAVMGNASAGGMTIERDAAPSVEGDQASERGGSPPMSESRDPQQPGLEQAQVAEGGEVRVVVHVDGAVESPGVYILSGQDLRINDAIAQAGGLAQDADTTSLNLAATLSDGQKVHVPREGEEVEPNLAATPEAPASAPDDMEGGVSGLVNINTATAEELVQLPGVGEKTAAAIIEDRESHGPYASIEDLMRVNGIGQKKLEKIRGLACV